MRNIQRLSIFLVIISALFFVACSNSTDTEVKEVLPELSLNINGEISKFALRSQTSKFLNDNKSTVEITLTNSRLAFCDNQKPELSENDKFLTINISNKDNQPLQLGSQTGNTQLEIKALLEMKDQRIELSQDQFQDLSFTDLNNAILRGVLNIQSEQLNLSGDFFTAICHN